MILEQFYLGCLSQASYLIGDEPSGSAVIVDPRRDVDLYVREAEARGLTIRHVLLTHIHADFVAGHLELRERTGATIHLGARAETEYPFEPMREGVPLDLGGVRLEFLETPGHTLESMCILVFGHDRRQPRAVLTGDTLFLGDVGRPDLAASGSLSAVELAGMLYDSIQGKLLDLPDSTLILPGHGAGSACGKNLSKETVSNMGEQRVLNYALGTMSRPAFIAAVIEGQQEAPAYFAHDVEMNRTNRATLDETLGRAMQPITLNRFLERQREGVQVLDSRPPSGYAKGHLAGTLNIGLDGRYAEWAGRLLDRDRPIQIVAEPGTEYESAMRLGRIGFDQVSGFLEGGPESLPDEERHSVRRTCPSALAWHLRSDDPPFVVDLRATAELEKGRIDGSYHIPLPELEERRAELPSDRSIVLHCAGGYRSMIGVSILARSGIAGAVDLAGGFHAWREGLPKTG